ncbi:hypothetical protein AB4Y72_14905 [Arthrobacter sp. YAF34]|uniref:hypothetical protein n=1 Tax=Arthrobacter sp. YAF34 TaxID=3233083 RepID=UPI003F91AFD2
MAAKRTKHLLAKFGSSDWSGSPGKEAGNVFLGSGFLTFLACLLLMIFIEPLRNVFVIIGVCTLVAIFSVVASVVSSAKREKAFLTGFTGRVNEMVLEITGDPNAQLSVGKLQDLIEDGGGVPLTINGVPGIELTVDGERLRERRVMADVTAPDYGLNSFDVLLKAEQGRSA